jgi:hypothetical protein
MLTKGQMLSTLKTMGLKRTYRPFNDPSNSEREGTDQKILLDTRRPSKIIDGHMKGCDIDIYDGSTLRVWTSRKKKANEIARTNGFKIKNYDGEIDLFLPANRADEFLHSLGAKVRSAAPVSPELRAKRIEALTKARMAKKGMLAAVA